MSTKIYDAYKYEGDIHRLLAILLKKRKEIKRKVVNELWKTHGMEIWNKKPITEENRFSLINYDYVKALSIDLQACMIDVYRNPFAYDCSAVVYFPPKDLFKTETYLFQVFGGYSDCLNFDKFESIQDFHYQNQTDQPEDISDIEWEYREMVWDEIFPSYLTPSETGLVFEFISINDSASLANSVEAKFRKYVNVKLKQAKKQKAKSN